MITNEINKAAKELEIVFQNMPNELLIKIPDEFQSFISEIKDNNHDFVYDKNLKLTEQNLLPKTQGLIALVYTIYLCDENEKKEFYKKYNKFQELLEEEKTSAENIFNYSQKENAEKNTEANIIEYKKESIFTRIWSKIKMLFKK